MMILHSRGGGLKCSFLFRTQFHPFLFSKHHCCLLIRNHFNWYTCTLQTFQCRISSQALRFSICGIFGSFDSIVLSFRSSYASSIVHIVLPIFDRSRREFILLFLQLFRAFRNFASRRVGHVTVWGCWIVGFILCPQSVVSSRLLILLFGGRPYFFFACIKHIRKNVSIKGETSVRLRRCGLKGISLLYSFSDKHLMHIQAVLVCVLHGTAEHITTLTIVHNRICEIMVNNTTFTAIWHRAKIHRILKAINK